ncbi:MAG: hypothetical protein WDN08_05325 [Rhizomicrobium sp.]
MSRPTQPVKLAAADAGLATLAALIGAVTGSPTANTLLDRLKTGNTAAALTNTLIGAMADAAWDGVTGNPASLVALLKYQAVLLKDIKTNTAA